MSLKYSLPIFLSISVFGLEIFIERDDDLSNERNYNSMESEVATKKRRPMMKMAADEEQEKLDRVRYVWRVRYITGV